MKRVLTLVLALATLLCAVASAETYKIQRSSVMESDLTDGYFYVGFSLDAVSATDITADIYEEVCYDLVDVHNMAVGDTIETADGDVEITSKEEDEAGYILINGGEDQGGVTLKGFDEDNCYHSMVYDLIEKMYLGQAQLTLADNVTINIFKHDEAWSPLEGYDTVTVAAADVAATLKDSLNGLTEELTPYEAKVQLEDGLLTEITVDYVP